VSRSRIRLLILTGLLSIFGTLVLQLIWLRQAVDLREREFNDRVVIALTEVVDRVQAMRGDSAVVEPVRQQASNAFVANLNDTLHPFLLEALLRESFERAALDSPFDYAIYDCFSDSIVYGGHVGGTESQGTMPPRFDRDGHYFGIRFPERRADILMSLDRWLLASILQLLVLGTFVYAVVIVLRQKRLSEVREDFINNMTHEFKTPIASIESGAQLLQRDEIGGDAKARQRYLDLILSENGRMRRQVDKVMEMATMEKGTVRLAADPIDLRHWAMRGVESALPTVERMEGKLTVKVPEDNTPADFVGDITHLDGVLRNLIDNAVRYSGDAPPDIEVRLECRSEAQARWHITVADRGIGVPADEAERIFDRFHRVPAGDRHDVKGFGLGLHYVRSIVEGHGGRIHCAPREGGGSRFIIQLPDRTS
jgi:two-component system phosphate regulon sensor histidine kinase PhoR